MPEAKTKDSMRCYFCRKPVPIKQHAEHMHILDSLIMAEAEGYEDLFVHTVGPGDEFDAEGNVAACDRCFIVELVDNLKTPYDHPEWLDAQEI